MPTLESSTSILESHHPLTPRSIEVQVRQAKDVDAALNNATALLLPTVMAQQCGIMVTRMATGKYIVQADAEVPFGLTQQRHA